MAYVLQLQLQNINELLQLNDSVYYMPAGGSATMDAVLIGTCSFIDAANNTIRVSGDLNINPPSANDYLFFTKDNNANLSSIKGYYAEVKIINNDYSNYSELFQVGLGVEESSK
ncbi:hypothetical protein N9D80_01380 [Flavobacteriales bacterium]|jgi:hypothetical protein|nr:hypothetical protein [Flavobacteriales bacterium]